MSIRTYINPPPGVPHQMRTHWRKDGWGNIGCALFFGNIFVGQILKWAGKGWRAWIMLTDDENDPGCHLGWFDTPDEARKAVQDRAEQEIESALSETMRHS